MTEETTRGVAQSQGQTKDNFEKAWAKRPWLNEEETDKDRAFRWWSAALALGNGAVEARHNLAQRLRNAECVEGCLCNVAANEIDRLAALAAPSPAVLDQSPHDRVKDPRDVRYWLDQQSKPTALDPVTVERCAKVAETYRGENSRSIRRDYEILIGGKISIAIRALIGQPASNGEPVDEDQALIEASRKKFGLVSSTKSTLPPCVHKECDDREWCGGLPECRYAEHVPQTNQTSGLWVCTGCGTRKSIEQIRGEKPYAVSCCPERRMVPPEEKA